MSTTSGRVSTRQRDRVRAVDGLADDLDVVLGVEQRAEAGPDQRLVVGHQDPDRHGAPRRQGRHDAPAAARLGAGLQRPAGGLARSRIPRTPCPAPGGAAEASSPPSSSTSITQGVGAARHPDAGVRAAGVPDARW